MTSGLADDNALMGKYPESRAEVAASVIFVMAVERAKYVANGVMTAATC